MKALIIQNKSKIDFIPFAKQFKKKGIEVSVVLIQDGVYLSQGNNGYSKQMQQIINQGIKINILAEDAKKRGLSKYILPNTEIIDYDQLVDSLFEDNLKVINF